METWKQVAFLSWVSFILACALFQFRHLYRKVILDHSDDVFYHWMFAMMLLYYVISALPTWRVLVNFRPTKPAPKFDASRPLLVGSSNMSESVSHSEAPQNGAWPGCIVIWTKLAGVASWRDLDFAWCCWTIIMWFFLVISVYGDALLYWAKMTPMVLSAFANTTNETDARTLFNEATDLDVAIPSVEEFMEHPPAFGDSFPCGSEFFGGLHFVFLLSDLCINLATAQILCTRGPALKRKTTEDARKENCNGFAMVIASLIGIASYFYFKSEHQSSGHFKLIPGVSSTFSLELLVIAQQVATLPARVCTVMMLIEDCTNVSINFSDVVSEIEKTRNEESDGDPLGTSTIDSQQKPALRSVARQFREIKMRYGTYLAWNAFVEVFAVLSAVMSVQYDSRKALFVPCLPLIFVILLARVKSVTELNTQVEEQMRNTPSTELFKLSSQGKLTFGVCGVVISRNKFRAFAIAGCVSILKAILAHHRPH